MTNVRGGIEYSDYLLLDNDCRFVSELAFDAAEHGAAIANYVEVTGAERVAGRWLVELRDGLTGTTFTETTLARSSTPPVRAWARSAR